MGTVPQKLPSQCFMHGLICPLHDLVLGGSDPPNPLGLSLHPIVHCFPLLIRMSLPWEGALPFCWERGR